MKHTTYQQQSRDLIDGLKTVCASNGLGNDGNEYKIIVQTFLYKLLCDKFTWEMKRNERRLARANDWIAAWQALPVEERESLEQQHDRAALHCNAVQAHGELSQTGQIS